jgi:hypothetical protein
VEWLLATHERKGTRGPVIWADEREKEPSGGGWMCAAPT